MRRIPFNALSTLVTVWVVPPFATLALMVLQVFSGTPMSVLGFLLATYMVLTVLALIIVCGFGYDPEFVKAEEKHRSQMEEHIVLVEGKLEDLKQYLQGLSPDNPTVKSLVTALDELEQDFAEQAILYQRLDGLSHEERSNNGTLFMNSSTNITSLLDRLTTLQRKAESFVQPELALSQ